VWKFDGLQVAFGLDGMAQCGGNPGMISASAMHFCKWRSSLELSLGGRERHGRPFDLEMLLLLEYGIFRVAKAAVPNPPLLVPPYPDLKHTA
jgi:hypothetical protein